MSLTEKTEFNFFHFPIFGYCPFSTGKYGCFRCAQQRGFFQSNFALRKADFQNLRKRHLRKTSPERLSCCVLPNESKTKNTCHWSQCKTRNEERNHTSHNNFFFLFFFWSVPGPVKGWVLLFITEWCITLQSAVSQLGALRAHPGGCMAQRRGHGTIQTDARGRDAVHYWYIISHNGATRRTPATQRPNLLQLSRQNLPIFKLNSPSTGRHFDISSSYSAQILHTTTRDITAKDKAIYVVCNP